MIFDKDTINQLIEDLDAKEVANPNIICDSDKFLMDTKKAVKWFTLDLKNHVDRWDLVVNHYIMHPEMMRLFSWAWEKEIDTRYTYVAPGSCAYSLFGAEIIVSADMPHNNIIALTDEYIYLDMRHVAIGAVDIEAWNRLNNLKAFW